MLWSTVKGFGVVNKAAVDGFLELSCFFDDPTDIGNLISGSPAFRDLNPSKMRLQEPDKEQKCWKRKRKRTKNRKTLVFVDMCITKWSWG